MMETAFNAVKHLLPRGRAWSLTANKQLRQFFEGISAFLKDVRVFLDCVWVSIFPSSTSSIAEWEAQFGLTDSGLTEHERRARIAATWSNFSGGQSPRYIEDTLRSNGFDVYVHEWWEPGTEPGVGVKQCVTPRNPFNVLRREYLPVNLLVECGEPLAQCGEPFAESGNSPEAGGYPLVNKIIRTVPDYVTGCGEPLAQCGEPEMLAGNFTAFGLQTQNYVIPNDPDKWTYLIYIGAQNYGDLASVPASRKNEFEALCLRICPTQNWLGMLVQYV